MNTQTETLNIEGMSCGHCVSAVSNALTAEGAVVEEVEIGKARVTYDTSRISHEQLVEAIEEIGYTVSSIKN